MLRTGLAQFDAIPEQALHYAQEVASARETYFWMLTLDAGITWRGRSLPGWNGSRSTTSAAAQSRAAGAPFTAMTVATEPPADA